ncbi:hypothetical protein B0920_14160 [Massilia sp. KIM]|uniref:hypothetical protein n=1 Tax=Massilia sp. KIM TaxID=1955422 RepID=UPI00098EF821|nr:hypothetical protein [Massilia sp. KIM]OON64420.1 hypothetical protein B0920_14160 [Massilia sp. KIM]
MDRRNDYKTALLIDNMLHDAAANGRAGVARELAEMGVPLEVTLRVLTRPGERRHNLPTGDLPGAP